MFESIIYKIDFVGISPQLLIFKNQRYKSILSLLISIILIMTTIIYTILTLYDYFKYQNPVVIYSKDNDQETNRKINLKDSFLLFQLVDASNFEKIDSSITYYEGEYKIMYDNGSYVYINLDIENCEIGKNINIKYKDYIENKYKFERSISDFYCINFKDQDLPLFYLPDVGYSYFSIHILKNKQIDFPSERIQSLISSENDLINHYDKKEPITQNHIHHFTTSFSSTEFTNIMYTFQYIKYESDEGFFYENTKNLDGMSFSDMSFYKIKQNNDLNNNNDNDNNNISRIGTITLEVNKAHFDSYKRSYKKVQALLAELMSVISLIFQIGGQVSIFLCEKKMSKDIIFNLINNIYSNKKIKLNLPNNNINILNTEHKNREINRKRKFNQNISKNSDNLNSYEVKINKEKTNKKPCNIANEEEDNNKNYINEINKKINYLHIIKSLFCFNDKKTKLIDLCHNIVTEDISIERIFERFYILENAYHFMTDKKNKNLFNENENLKEICKYINEIYHDDISQKENINSEIDNNN